MQKRQRERRVKTGRRSGDWLNFVKPLDSAEKIAQDVAALVREMPASREYFEHLVKKLQSFMVDKLEQ